MSAITPTGNTLSPTEHSHLLSLLKQVTDPEIPVLTIDEIGILRGIAIDGDTLVVTITPTYSGCPAMDQIREAVDQTLVAAGYTNSRVDLVLSPAWTTDWMTEAARQKLQEYGIAPPCHTNLLDQHGELPLTFTAACPQCQSTNTRIISEFGSTACKALWQCRDCLEPFDFFKPI